jgi:PAS domain S-box-containing protein
VLVQDGIRTRWNPRVVVWSIALIVFLLLSATNFLLWENADHLNKDLARNQTRSAAEQVALRIERFMDERTNDLALLAAFWSTHSDSEREQVFLGDATRIVEREASYEVINFVDDQSIIRLVAPPGKRPDLMDLDLKTLPGREELHQQVRESGQPLSSPLMTMTTGNPGLVIWFPIITRQNGATTFEGMVAGVFDISDFLEHAAVASSPAGVWVKVQIEGVEAYAEGGPGVQLASFQKEIESQAQIAVLGRTWTIYAYPRAESAFDRLPRNSARRLAVSIAVSLLVSGLLAWALFSISHLRRSRQRVRESEQLYRTLVENFPSGVVLLFDHDLRYLLADGASLNEIGLSKAALEGKTIGEALDPETAAALEPPYRAALRGEHSLVEVPYAGHIFRVQTVPIRNVHNHILGGMAVAEDITDSKRAEEEYTVLTERIREQAQQVQQIIDTVPEGVLLLDSQEVVLQANPVAQEYLPLLAGVDVGQRVRQLGGRPLGELLTSPPKGLWHELMADGDPPQFFEMIARPIETGPTPGGWVVVIRDVTREREIQQRAQRQERLAAVGQLAAGIAHDFNNIMAVIVLSIQIVLRMGDYPPRVQDRLKMIATQAHRAADLIQQILDFSRQSVMERRPLDLLPFLKEQVQLFKRTLPENIVIGLDYDSDAYLVNADLTRIQQVVLNLAVNARDAMPDGGQLSIGLHRLTVEDSKDAPLLDLTPGEWVQLTVSDTGTGITPAVLPRIFEPFFTTKAPGKGSGLGLAQVYGIVRQHEGHIDVQTQFGVGTTFTIYLPALPAQPTESLGFDVGELTQGAGEMILVVEDDLATRETVIASLELLNYRVVAAPNGLDALSVWEHHADSIVLVLSDMVMPGMGGIALFYALRERAPALKMVLMTGHPLENHVDSLQELGVTDWILKPPGMKQLAGVIARVLGKS